MNEFLQYIGLITMMLILVFLLVWLGIPTAIESTRWWRELYRLRKEQRESKKTE